MPQQLLLAGWAQLAAVVTLGVAVVMMPRVAVALGKVPAIAASEEQIPPEPRPGPLLEQPHDLSPDAHRFETPA